jgi:hypothetical protein
MGVPESIVITKHVHRAELLHKRKRSWSGSVSKGNKEIHVGYLVGEISGWACADGIVGVSDLVKSTVIRQARLK